MDVLCDRCRTIRPRVHSVVVPFIISKEKVSTRDGPKKLRNVWLCDKCLKELKILIHSWARSLRHIRINMSLYSKQ